MLSNHNIIIWGLNSHRLAYVSLPFLNKIRIKMSISEEWLRNSALEGPYTIYREICWFGNKIRNITLMILAKKFQILPLMFPLNKIQHSLGINHNCRISHGNYNFETKTFWWTGDDKSLECLIIVVCKIFKYEQLLYTLNICQRGGKRGVLYPKHPKVLTEDLNAFWPRQLSLLILLYKICPRNPSLVPRSLENPSKSSIERSQRKHQDQE